MAPTGAMAPPDVGPLQPMAATALRKRARRRDSALGWFSLCLGLTQLLAPKRVARLIGVDDEDELTQMALRLVGARELACGLGLLSQPHSSAWAWTRVAGDVMDLALLGRALQSRDARADRLLAAGAAVVGVACVDAYSAYDVQRQAGNVGFEGLEVRESITIARPPEAVYAFCRDFHNLSRFLPHVQSIRVDNGRSHWSVKGPLGTSIEWDAEIVEDHPNALIVWRSLPDGDVTHQGRVELRTSGNGDTELDLLLRYDPPVGKAGAALAELLGLAPAPQISAELRRLKQVLETGEVLHSDASIHPGMHPARPSELSAQIGEEVLS
jgi:uncharacterized membrane protein